MPSGGEHVITVHGEPAGSAGALSTAAGDATQPERIDRLSGSATNDGVSSSEAGSSAPPSTTPSVDLTPAASDAKQPSPPAVSETAKQPPPPAALEKQPSRLTTHRRSLAKGQVPDELPVSFSKYDLAPKGIDRFVIHPDNKFKSIFEVFIIFCVLYTAVVEPLKVTYVLTILPEVDDFLDLIFAFDIFFQCFCGYHDSGGQRFPVLHFREVVTNYARTWFFIDLVAAVPFDRFFNSENGSVLIRVPGLIKTVRLLKLRRIMRKWNALSFGPLLKVITILGFWVLCAHWVACIFFIIGWYSCGGAPGEDDTWVTVYWPGMKQDCISGNAPNPAAVLEPLPGMYTMPVTYYSVHIRCMYWAMATMSSMGYGRAPTAFTDTEYTYSIASQIMGACLAAAIFSNIGQMLNKGDQVTARYQAQLDKVREFSKLYKLPKPLRAKLAGYNELLFAVSRGYDTASIASMFPAAVQEEIFTDMHREAVMRVPMFKCSGCDESFFAMIVRQLRVNVLLEGDFVFRMGEVGDRMYFIKTGYLQIGSPDRSVVFVSKGPGSYFGELTMFNPGMRRNASAWSLSDCILFTLDITDFYSVLQRYDKDNSLYNQMKSISLAQSHQQTKQNTSTHRRSSAEPDEEMKNSRRPSRFARFTPTTSERIAAGGAVPLTYSTTSGSSPSSATASTSTSNSSSTAGGRGGGTIDHMLTQEKLITAGGGASPGPSTRAGFGSGDPASGAPASPRSGDPAIDAAAARHRQRQRSPAARISNAMSSVGGAVSLALGKGDGNRNRIHAQDPTT